VESGPAPSAGPVSLARRLRSPHTLVSLGFAAAILWFAVRRLDVDPAAIWEQIRRANPALLGAAFCFWYGSFFVRAWRWRHMLGTAGVVSSSGREMPPTPQLAQIMLLAWFVNSLLPAKLGDAYRGYLLKREAGVPFSAGIGTVLAERFADAMMLLVVLAGSGLVVFGRDLPPQARPALTLAGIVLVAGAAGLSLMWLTRDALLPRLPHRLRDVYMHLHGGVFGSLRNPALVLGIGGLLWLGDGTRVWLVAHALGADISPAVALLVAVTGALLTVIPFTPAGLGVVELGVGSMLIGVFGLDPVLAGSIIVLDRVVGYWSLLVVGTLLYLHRTRRDYQAAPLGPQPG
jgi:uncharacterized membrane protein YbhN (UPF0104 family)